ncbi:LacI family DNA-binding transcriptional regulator [Kineococcus gynurae]|uniref:LacI family DNA-binding transcriptional regulator n=1 Tax=Kineococcus gynurae TaxID=452979 RepID=A0ABV5LSX8_9ACTN
MSTRPTIRSVAARAGVSKSLVSLVLQDSPKVGPERRAAVMAAIEELGYRPDPTARSLAERRTRTIGVVLDDLRNPWFVDLLDGLRPVLLEAGLRPVLGDTRTEPDVAAVFAQLRVDGLVVVGTREDPHAVEEVARGVPTVLAGSRDSYDAPVDTVAGDDRAGVRLLVVHLVGLGHRRIGHVAGTGSVGRLRRAAVEESVRAAGGEVLVATGDMTEDAGFRCGLELLGGRDRPSAVVGANDVSAVGLLAAADELGLRVPEDVSVTGYDDIALARSRRTALTTVDNGAARVGGLAGEELLARIADPHRAPVTTLVPPRLVVRTTTGPAPDLSPG